MNNLLCCETRDHAGLVHRLVHVSVYVPDFTGRPTKLYTAWGTGCEQLAQSCYAAAPWSGIELSACATTPPIDRAYRTLIQVENANFMNFKIRRIYEFYMLMNFNKKQNSLS